MIRKPNRALLGVRVAGLPPVSMTGCRAKKAGPTGPPSRRRVRVAEGIYKDRQVLAATERQFQKAAGA